MKVRELLVVLDFSLEGIGTTWHLTIFGNDGLIVTKRRTRGEIADAGIEG